jgi:hypothetical protein
MRRKTLAGWGFVLACTAVTFAAHAQDAERLRIAAEEFDAGRRSYKVKDFENAAVHFENADRDAPSPDALFAAIRSRREAQHLARAATLAATGLVRYPDDKQLVEYADQVLAEADKALHKVMIGCTPKCTLVLDKKLLPVAENTSATIYIDPGPHEVVAGWTGERRVSKSVTAVAGGVTQLKHVAPVVEKPVAPPPEPAPVVPKEPADTGEGASDKGSVKLEPSSSGLPPAVFLVGLGVTAVVGGITIWSGIDTKSNPGVDAVKSCNPDISGQDYCQGLLDKGIASQNRTNVLLIGTAVVGVATGVVGVFLTNWSGAPDKAKKKGASLAPIVSFEHGLTVGAVGRF